MPRSLSSGAVAADPDKIDAKRAQAQGVLAQIHEMDMELELAIDEWNGANVRLQQIEGELEVNRKRLEIAEHRSARPRRPWRSASSASTRTARSTWSEVVLGATSFDDMIDGIDTANRVAEDDARIVEAVKRSKAEVQHQRKVLERAHARQEQIVAQRADRRAEIEQGLAEREALYESVKGEIAQLEAEERARQTRLAAQARRQAAAIDARQAQRENQEQEPDPAPAPAPSPAPSPEPSPAPSPPPAGRRPPRGRLDRAPLPRRAVPLGARLRRGFDCSGFRRCTSTRRIGISLPHYVSWQYR